MDRCGISYYPDLLLLLPYISFYLFLFAQLVGDMTDLIERKKNWEIWPERWMNGRDDDKPRVRKLC